MNRRVNRRYQTPLPPDFVHFLVEEQGLSEWHYQDAKMSKDEFEETVKDLNDYYWRLLISLALSAFEAQKRDRVVDPQGIR